MRLLQTSVGVGFLAIAAACSSSSSPPASSGPGPSDAAAVVPIDGPISQLNPPTMMMPPAPVMCGSKMCDAPPSSGAGITLAPCCRPDNSCGASFMMPGMSGGSDAGGGCLSTSPGTPNMACPKRMTMGFTLQGCCTTDGLCGLDLTMAGLGCNPPSELGMAMMGDGGPPETCAAAEAAAEAGVGSEAGPTGADGH